MALLAQALIMAIALMVIVAVLLAVATNEHGEAGQHHHGQHHPLVEGVLDMLGAGPGGELRQVGHVELGVGHPGQYQHLGTAPLLLAIDVRLVARHFMQVRVVGGKGLARIGVFAAGARQQAALGLGHQILAGTKNHGAGGAYLDTAGQLALIDPLKPLLVTELALVDRPQGVVVVIFGHIERAAHHAVAATGADARVIVDYAGFGIFFKGLHRTDGDAVGIDAVHALLLDVGIAIHQLILVLASAALPHLNDVVGVGGQLVVVGPGLCPRRIGRVAIQTLTLRHAGLTADAEGGVVEHAERPGNGRLVLGRRHGAAGHAGPCRQCTGGGEFEEIASVHGHSSRDGCCPASWRFCWRPSSRTVIRLTPTSTPRAPPMRPVAVGEV